MVEKNLCGEEKNITTLPRGTGISKDARYMQCSPHLVSPKGGE